MKNQLKGTKNLSGIKIFIARSPLRYLVLDKNGKAMSSGDENKDDWRNVFVDINSIKVGEPIKLSFNYYDEHTKEPVFSYLNYNTSNIQIKLKGKPWFFNVDENGNKVENIKL